MKSLAVFAIFALIIATQLIELTLCEVVGALYFMLNAPDKNPLIVNSINRTGTLKYVKTVDNPGSKGTGGLGELQSSNSLIVSDNFIFCVNAGSNSVSSFLIKPNDALYVVFNDIIDSGGEFPNALAYSPHHSMLCVSNAGVIESAGVFCFTVNSITFKLTPMPGKLTRFFVPTYPLPSVPPGFGSPGDILFMDNDKYVAVSIRGIPTNQALGEIEAKPPGDEVGAVGHILTFQVVPGSQLAPISANPIGAFPSSMNYINFNEGNTVGFTDPGTGEVRVYQFKNGHLRNETGWPMHKIENQQFIGRSDFIKRGPDVYYYIIDSKNLNGEATVTAISYYHQGVFTFNTGQPYLLDGRILRIDDGYYLYVIQAVEPLLGQSGIIILELQNGNGTNIRAQTPFHPTVDGKPLPPSIIGLGFYLNP